MTNVQIQDKNNISGDKFDDTFTSITDTEINHIRQNYKIIDVDWTNWNWKLVNSQICGDDYFKKFQKKMMINDMFDYYLTHKDIQIYLKTDYLCNEKEKLCICNTNAEYLRKIYDGSNFKKGDKYISWFKEIN
jgi:hypothetical protein